MTDISIKESRRLLSIVLVVIVSVLIICLSTGNTSTLNTKTDAVYAETGNILYNAGVPKLSSTGGEWVIIGMSRGGYNTGDSYYKDYYENVVNKLTEKNGVLSKRKNTEYSRVIISLTSIGKDVRNVGGYNLLENLADFDKVKLQGINGPIWALIALDCGGYEIPKTEGLSQTTREKLIEYILNSEIKTGGWALGGSVPEADVTSMAITSLAKYYTYSEDVRQAVDRGVETLSKIQNQKGCFTYNKVESCESVAQAVTCLSTLGIDADKDKKFIKNSKSLIDSLLDFYIEGIGFAHTKGGVFSQLATEQAYYSIVAYNRFIQGKTSLFDMTDITAPEVTLPTVFTIPTVPNVTTAGTTVSSTAKTRESVLEHSDTAETKVNISEETLPESSENKTIEKKSVSTAGGNTKNTGIESINVIKANNITESTSKATDASTAEKNSTVKDGLHYTKAATTQPTTATSEITKEKPETNDNNILTIVAGSITGIMVIILAVLITIIIKRKIKK